MRAVCSYFKHVVESSIVLQYFIKLDMLGYTDGSRSLGALVIAATRLYQLEEHIDAWNTLYWVESHLDAPSVRDHFCVLCQGILATFDHKISRKAFCVGNGHSISSHFLTIVLIQELQVTLFSVPIGSVYLMVRVMVVCSESHHIPTMSSDWKYGTG
ncbi:hypothetical protein BS47DRAFT_90441 [Hydnum rufescens UP504]|uniref:Uncharacterized protein n=1 Tax=Hydnum rufescens UP504 TaxID=1448309 RepID=A0A9P6DU90_9AGAM|nr:hypothetical protein BS47DRAFT_90441 [Hydnum rufescens UP504]